MSGSKVLPAGVEHHVDPTTGELLAMIVRGSFRGGRYNFFTPDDFPLQLGQNFYPPGETIEAHTHVPQERHVNRVNEFIYLVAGRLLLHLFALDRSPVKDVELVAGDCVLLTGGGHGFEVLEESRLLEVKQGPYLGVEDKVKLASGRATTS